MYPPHGSSTVSYPGISTQKPQKHRRTELLADLELTGITLGYRGETLKKNDIFALFDELQSENTLAWHIAIAMDKTLLTFLEDLHFDDFAVNNHYVRYLNTPLYEDDAFIRWISPYYYDSFMFYMEITCLRESNVHALIALLDVPLLMTAADKEKAWQAVVRLMVKPIEQIKRYGAIATSETHLAKTGHWMEEAFLQLLHLLPEEHFGPVRDRYALAIFEACDKVRRKDPRYPVLTKRWMENAVVLALSPIVKRRLTARQKKALGLGEHIRRIKKIPLRVWIILIIGLLMCYWAGHHRH